MESAEPYLFFYFNFCLCNNNFNLMFWKKCIILWLCFVTRLKDSSGWQHAFTSPHIESCIERIAINAKMGQGGGGESSSKMVAISYGSQVRLWGVSEDGTRTDVGELYCHWNHIVFCIKVLKGKFLLIINVRWLTFSCLDNCVWMCVLCSVSQEQQKIILEDLYDDPSKV